MGFSASFIPINDEKIDLKGEGEDDSESLESLLEELLDELEEELELELELKFKDFGASLIVVAVLLFNNDEFVPDAGRFKSFSFFVSFSFVGLRFFFSLSVNQPYPINNKKLILHQINLYPKVMRKMFDDYVQYLNYCLKCLRTFASF